MQHNDTNLKKTGVNLLNAATQHSYSYSWQYNATSGRLDNVNATIGGTPYQVSYTYKANTPLIETLTYKNNQDPKITTSRSYDQIYWLTGQSQSANGQPLGVSSLEYKLASQRTAANMSDGTRWEYQYDPLGQVTKGQNDFVQMD